METTVNSKTNTNEKRYNLTTKSLGIADAKAKNLAGYVLSQRELSNAATKVLIAVGIRPEDIRDIKVGSDIKTQELRIICEVKYKAAFPPAEKKETGWLNFKEYDDSPNKSAFNKAFYDALYNKVYHGKKKHLNIKVIRRDDKKFVSFEFDPQIFIAFVYDIVFTDPLYKVSAVPTRWKPESVVNDMKGSDRKAYKNRKKEYLREDLCNCVAYVTFNPNAVYTDDNSDKGARTAIKGFHPCEVDAWYEGSKA